MNEDPDYDNGCDSNGASYIRDKKEYPYKCYVGRIDTDEYRKNLFSQYPVQQQALKVKHERWNRSPTI